MKNVSDSAISLFIQRKHRENEVEVNKKLGLDEGKDKGSRFMVKLNLGKELPLIKKLHPFFNDRLGGFKTRSSFIIWVFRLGLQEAAARMKKHLEMDKEIEKVWNKTKV